MDEKENHVYEAELSFTDGRTLTELLAELLLERPCVPEGLLPPC